ncbi:INVERT_DEFENSINS domain-containing protein [Nephila pilipes]|uniref:INVERT_DEFENSINS domain-containing protein n=1 Tax=Nephila pilipes TaxID=299642 RepID=A0A8X6TTY7_NEPPI|nr:INVERT_DEFENSINS domain-containing protein [Nephila pilipes]
MAVTNSLLYILYSLASFSAKQKPTTDVRERDWSQPPVTESYLKDATTFNPITFKDETNCPPGEAWSDCDAGCEHNCSNAGKPLICPRMCVPGCVCDDPGTVRGPDGKCIPAPLCPASPRSKPLICPRMCVPGCVCDDPGTVRGPDGKCIPAPLCPASPRTGFFPETKSTLMSQELYGLTFSSTLNRHST